MTMGFGGSGGGDRQYQVVFAGNQPTYYRAYYKRPEGLLSPEEKLNLGIAIAVLTVCLTLVMYKGTVGPLSTVPDNMDWLILIATMGLVSTSTAFALHEMAHKFVAQRYGCWAEFRYSTQGLLLALFLALFTPFLFAAPGAVYIVGNIDRRQNGIISIAGPMTNVVVALVMLPLFLWGPGIVAYIAFNVIYFNAFLAVFNMIPFMPLDGAKVLKWNIPLYVGAMACMGALLLFVFTVLPSL